MVCVMNVVTVLYSVHTLEALTKINLHYSGVKKISQTAKMKDSTVEKTDINGIRTISADAAAVIETIQKDYSYLMK